MIFFSPHEKRSLRFEPKKCHANNAGPYGWNLQCDKVRDTRPKTPIGPLKDTKLGVPRASFDLITAALFFLCATLKNTLPAEDGGISS